ncbi:hypothetical protein HGRIS_014395 [Hohenbuehelia grisea]|uniref:GTP-binding protein 2 n=1 Tax=Hohenbuehelia grisea TaxID=104357 RepID=A0ABR3JTI7_9AGAR
MFGEDESESPRVPSPWDSLISTPPDSSAPSRQSPSPLGTSVTTSSSLAPMGVPKLVPEMEEGNIEYKLQLLNPSPARFARLVTQLKWRLLEGGGQAYYELGVADSGDLVGLPREDLERTLETLEMMAGEIGASVIVVKEIEVPACMRMAEAGDAKDRANTWWGEVSDGQTKKRYGRHRRQPLTEKEPWSRSYDGETEGYSTTTQDESEFSTDAEPSESPNAVREPPGPIFDMDPEEPDDNNNRLPRTHSFPIELEIASVYKPRPMRRRMPDPRNLDIPGKRDRRHGHGKAKEFGPKKASHGTGSVKGAYGNAHNSHSISTSANTVSHTNGHSRNGQAEGSKEMKALARRHNRDRRREDKHRALTEAAEAAISGDSAHHDHTHAHSTVASLTQGDVDHIVEGLHDMHVSLADSSVTIKTPSVAASATTYTHAASPAEPVEDDGANDDDVINIRVLPPPKRAPHTTADGPPRLIVEALVVRKMSLEEAFLDFGGFEVV